MTIEDRVRQLLHDAVADEPPLRGAPLEKLGRRRRRRHRPVLVGGVALVLVLAAVVGLAAVRPSAQRPLGQASATKGWRLFTDTADNLRFRYPPDWRVERVVPKLGPEMLWLVPPELAGVPVRRRELSVRVDAAARFWIGSYWFGTTSQGRLPGGQAYLRAAGGPTDQVRHTVWSVDWGRPCLGEGPGCVPHSVQVSMTSANRQLWERHAAVVETVVGTLEQLRPTHPSTGDRTLPACRADQWRLVWPEEYAGAGGNQDIGIEGGVQHRTGPRCHLRLTVRMAVEDGTGRLLPVRGNPASTTIEGDLPVDGMQWLDGSWSFGDGALVWRFQWDQWCNRGLPRATMRVTADGGASALVPGFDPASDRDGGCEDRGRPSVVAGWP